MVDSVLMFTTLGSSCLEIWEKAFESCCGAGIVSGVASDARPQNLRPQDFRRQSRRNVLIKNDKVGEHPRLQLALLLFGKLGKRRARRVGRDRLLDIQFLGGIVTFLSVFAHTCKRRVEP